VDGEAVVRAAETLLQGYGDHPRAAEAAEILADYRYALGEYKAAARHYATAAGLSAGEARVRCLLARGRALLGASDYTAATAVFEEVLTLAPRTSEARLGIADAALLAGEVKRAVTLYTQMLNESPRSDPATPIGLAQRLRALDTLGRSDEAVADARRLVEEYPRSSEAAAVRDRLRREKRERAAETDATPNQPGTATAPARRPPARTPAGREAPSPIEEPAQAGAYSLQLGAFGNEANAQDLADRVAELRVSDVRIEREDRGGRIFYRVRCGSYSDPEAAEAEGRRLAEHGLRYQVVAR
jgi:tetratricopeptide (TPR) repeat protein